MDSTQREKALLKLIGVRSLDVSHYRFFGLEDFIDDPDAIEAAADRLMAHARTFQNGALAQISQTVLNQAAERRLVLLTPDKKQAYDQQLRRQSAPLIETELPAPGRRPSHESGKRNMLVIAGVSAAAIVVVVAAAAALVLRPGGDSAHETAQGSSDSVAEGGTDSETPSPADAAETQISQTDNRSTQSASHTANATAKATASHRQRQPHAEETDVEPWDVGGRIQLAEANVDAGAPRRSGQQWFDALATFDSKRNVTKGTWRVEDGEAISSEAESTIAFPIPEQALVKNHYDVVVDFTKADQDERVMISFPVTSTKGVDFGTAVLSGWNGAASGIRFIDDINADRNASVVRPGRFPGDVRYRAVVSVQPEADDEISVSVYLAAVEANDLRAYKKQGQPYTYFKGAPDRISSGSSNAYLIPEAAVGITSHREPLVVHGVGVGWQK